MRHTVVTGTRIGTTANRLTLKENACPVRNRGWLFLVVWKDIIVLVENSRHIVGKDRIVAETMIVCAQIN